MGDVEAPRFSILTPVYDPSVPALLACLNSVDVQEFDSWEHIVVDDGSRDPRVHAALDAGERCEGRTVQRRGANGGIVAASNDALALARGEFVVLLDNDDVLEPEALVAIDEAIEAASVPGSVDMVYSDHDLIRVDGRFVSPIFKPDFSPELLRNHNFVTHLVALRRQNVEEVGGFRAGFDGAQDHDLLLRVSERGGQILHIPRILVHWRQSEASVASSTANKPGAFSAGVRAVQDHLDRLAQPALVETGAYDGVYRVRRTVDGSALVSVVMATRWRDRRIWGEKRMLVLESIRSLLADTELASRLEIIVVADDDPGRAVQSSLERLGGERLVLLDVDPATADVVRLERGVAAAAGEYVLFLDDETELLIHGSIDEMVGLARQSDVGMVGAKLLRDDGTVRHAGFVTQDEPRHAFAGWPLEHPGPNRLLCVERECSAVSTKAALMPRELVDRFGVPAPGDFGAADLGQRLRNAGLRIVWTPHACWYDFTQPRAGISTQAEPLDGQLFPSRDPYYNVNLVADRADWLERPGHAGAPPFVRLPDGSISWA
jgi:glycosyltransferase involved in cell wall biosynthesis